jgi:hypothetical protein
MADSPVWATRLRQLGPEVIAILQQHGNDGLQHVRVFSRPGRPAVVTVSTERVMPERHLSTESQRLITQTAAGIEDEGLRTALLKLAAHGAEHNNRQN